MKLKTDALRLALMSLGVLVGGVLLLVGVANLVLRLRGEPAPGYAAILAFTLLGLVLLGAPAAVAVRDVRRGR